MPTSQIQFTGINRTISDFALSGSCEELINLRPTAMGLAPARVKAIAIKDISTDIEEVYAHHIGGITRYITKKVTVSFKMPSGTRNTTVTFAAVKPDGNGGYTQIATLITFSDTTGKVVDTDKVYVATIGNIIVISSNLGISRGRVPDGDANYAFRYDKVEDTYNSIGNDSSLISPLVDLVTGSTAIQTDTLTMSDVLATYSDSQLREFMSIHYEKLMRDHPTLAFGPFILAVCLKMKDGNTFWTYEWAYSNCIAENISKFPEMRKSGMVKFAVQEVSGSLVRTTKFTSLGSVVSASLHAEAIIRNPSMEDLESVCIYTSRPIPAVNIEEWTKNDDTMVKTTSSVGVSTVDTYTFYAPLLGPAELTKHIEGSLLYLQKEIPIADIVAATSPIVIDLRFGGDDQLTKKTLEVDAGPLTRVGDMYAYNDRLHFFRSTARLSEGRPMYSTGKVFRSSIAYVELIINGETRVLTISDLFAFDMIGDTGYFFYPDSRCVAIYIGPDSPYFYIPMQPSERYNFSFHIGIEGTRTVTELPATPSADIRYDEPQDINVTEQLNPFVFNVANSYRIPGTVLDVQAQLLPVSEVAYGQWPLNVFTDLGIFALQQGDGSVLYSNIVPVSQQVSKSNSAATDNGTFFLASDGVYLLMGRKSVLVSDALDNGPHIFLRSNLGYQTICRGDALYNIQPYESSVPFREYIIGASLVYDIFRQELIVSNPHYRYSYVLSVLYRQWYKISYSVSQAVAGESVALAKTKFGIKQLLDLAAEAKDSNNVLYPSGTVGPWTEKAGILVHLETRPLSPATYNLSHIHRIVDMVRADLIQDDNETAADKNLSVALYGSDDLTTWKYLVSSQRAGIQCSQIRTSKSPRSFRYYKLTIGGKVPYDTDFGPVLVDWDPVIRRLG